MPTVRLETTRNGDTVHVRPISGDPAPRLQRNGGACRFKFELTDTTGLGVRFESLDREDCSSTCPPAEGDNSDQIVGVRMNGTEAWFTDNNNNKAPDMPVTYQWNFTCNDPQVTVEPFDPTIINGGKT